MKVILFLNSLGAGGAERSMLELAKYLRAQEDVQVKIVCLERRKIGIEEEANQAGIETIFYRGRPSLLSKTRFFSNVVNKENPDIIHSALADSNLVLRFSRFFKRRRGKIVQSLVSTPYSEARRKDRRLPWYKFQIVKVMDALSARLTPNIFYHAITKEVLEHHRSLYKIQDNFEVIHRGRYSNRYYPSSSKREKFTLINVGRQEFAKGQLGLLKAYSLLKKELPPGSLRLEILGRTGNCSEELTSYIQKENLGNEVVLKGFVDDVDLHLAQAHVFVFPSYYEGLGGALIEAFSAGLPCVCSDIPTFHEVVGSKEGALFASPGDHEELARKIMLLYQDDQLRQNLGDKARNRFEESFQMETINDRMLKMYRKLNQSTK